MNDDVLIVTSYVGAWMWHIIAVIFLSQAAVLLALTKAIWAIVFFVVAGFAEYMAWKRQKQLGKWETQI